MIGPDHPFRSELCRRIGHTLPGRLAVFAHHWPERVALREKHRGLWREYRWAEYQRLVAAAAEGLRRCGVARGDRIAIIADNRPEWLFADLGAQLLGAISAGIYTTNPPADVAYVLNHARAKVVFCEDQEQLDKVLHAPEPLPHLQHIVVLEPEGTAQYRDARLTYWPDFLARQAMPDPQLHQRLAALDSRAPAVLVYTSGTTAQPKGALLSAHNMLALSEVQLDELGGDEHDTLLSYLPLCHVAEKIFSLFTPLTSGAVVHFGESLDTVRQDLAEVAPTVFLGVPRIWEKMHSGCEVAIRNASAEKRALYRWAVGVGRRYCAAAAPIISPPPLAGESRGGGRSAPASQPPSASVGRNLWLRFQRTLADWLVLRALRERMGLNRIRLAVSGAAPIAPELLAWFHAIGVPILEGWGLTESSGLSHINRPGRCRLGTVGLPVRGCEYRLAGDGEILVRGPHVFLGYLDNDAATRETISADGWLHTGDLGAVDADGFLRIVGRKKEILITAGGKNLSPAKIENALKTSPYIKEAAAIADGRPFAAALIQIDPDLVGDWATRENLAFTSFEDLSGKPEVVKLIDGEVRRINEAQLARVEQVRAFRLLPKELHQDDGEVTATQKIKRRVLYEKFAPLIEDIYRKGAA